MKKTLSKIIKCFKRNNKIIVVKKAKEHKKDKEYVYYAGIHDKYMD